MAERKSRNWAEMPEGRSKIWRGIRFLKKFTLEDLIEVTAEDYSHTRKYVQALVEAGYLRLIRKANRRQPASLNQYQLVRDSGPLPPLPRTTSSLWDPNTESEVIREPVRTGRDRAWAALRSLPQFGVQELVRVGLARKNAQKFLGALAAAGYLRVVLPKQDGPGAREAIYVLVRNTGPLTPVVRRDGSVVDNNVREVFSHVA